LNFIRGCLNLFYFSIYICRVKIYGGRAGFPILIWQTNQTNAIVEAGLAPTPQVAGYYSILGQKLPKEPESGLYIIIYDNGKSGKVLK